MSLGFRALMPVVCLTVGTWIGLGMPDEHAVQAFGKRTYFAIAGTPTASDAPYRPVVIDPPPQTVDVRPLGTPAPPSPDPVPRLNPDARVSRAWLLAEGPYHPPGDNKRLVTFTFDDGPTPEITPLLLDVLDRFHVRASFFILGRYLVGDDARAQLARDVLRRTAAAGHLVGNHTFDHRHLTELSRPRALGEIDEGSAAIEKVLGYAPKYFRPPYGDLSRFLESTLSDRGTEIVLWSIEVGDMLRDDPEGMSEEMKQRLEYAGGGVVLLHDVKWKSIVALGKLLRWLDENRYDPNKPTVKGYEVVDLEQYIRATAASPQPFKSRQALDDTRRDAWIHMHPAQKPPGPVAQPKRADVVL